MLKATGIVRKVDELGRIVLPVELRRTLGIEDKDALEIYATADSIVLKKYERGCMFCGTMNPQVFKGKLVCKSCMQEMVKGLK